MLALASGLLLAVDLSVWHRSIELIGAGLATVLGNTQVVFVGFAAWLLHSERPSRHTVLVVPFVFAGVIFISGLGRADAYGDNPVSGALFGILTGFSYACYLLVFRASNRELAPAAGPLLDSTLGATLGCLLVGAFRSRLHILHHLAGSRMVAGTGAGFPIHRLALDRHRASPSRRSRDIGYPPTSTHAHRPLGLCHLHGAAFDLTMGWSIYGSRRSDVSI